MKRKNTIHRWLALPTSLALILGSSTAFIMADEPETDEIVEESPVGETPTEKATEEVLPLGNESESTPAGDESNTAAASVTVGGVTATFATLQEAIDNANGGTVTLLQNVNENITITSSVTLDLGEKTIKGLGNNSVITVKEAGSVSISNGTITGGTGQDKEYGKDNRGDGAGIFSYNSDLSLSNVTITENHVSSATPTADGGAIAVIGGSITILNSTMTSNSTASNGNGGAMYIMNATAVKIDNTTISNNTAGYGGAISIGDTDGTLQDSFEYIISNTTISNNESTNMAGAIYESLNNKSTKSSISIVNSTITGNKTDTTRRNGGAVYIGTGDMTVKNSTVSGNSAYRGGAFYVLGIASKQAHLTIDNSHLIENMTTNNGAGIFVTGNAEVNISGSEISKNTSSENGGGLYISKNSAVTIADGTNITNNTAATSADDIYNEEGATLNLGSVVQDVQLVNPCQDTITGWYQDNEGSRWNAHSENHESDFVEKVETGTYTSKLSLKAAHGTGKVIVHYVDEEKKPLLTDENGNEITDTLVGVAGEAYTTTAKTIDTYTLVTTPDNASGTYIEDTINVTYVYTKTKGTLIVHYVDESNTKLCDDIIFTDVVGKEYTTGQKSFDGYTFVSLDGEKNGTLIDGTIEVTYHYKKNETKKTDDNNKSDSKKTNGTQTGVSNNTGLYAGLGCGAAIILGIVVAISKKKKG